MKTAFRGDNLNDVRERNTRLVLRALLRHGSLSRRQLSDLTGLVPTTIGNIVGELIGRDWLVEIGPQDPPDASRRGPRQVLVDLNPHGAAVLGVVLGIYSRTVSLVGPRGQILARTEMLSHSPEADAREALDWTVETAHRLLRESGLPASAVIGTGVAAEGLVDPAAGVRIFVPYRNWREVPVARDLENRLGLPTVVANTAHAQAMGEIWFGGAGEVESLLFVELGTTINCAAVARHEVLQSHRYAAGAIGHVVVREGGELCVCGRRGCLETVAGEDAVVAAGQEALRRGGSPHLQARSGGRSEMITPSMVALAARDGDPAAGRILQEAAIALGCGLAFCVTLLQPEMVVLWGILPTDGGPAFLGPLQQTIARLAVPGRSGLPPFVSSDLGLQSAEIGAAALALDRFFYSPQLGGRGKSLNGSAEAWELSTPVAAGEGGASRGR